MVLEENVPLSSLTTFRLGGPARFFVRVHTLEDLTDALAHARSNKLRMLVLGGGSNMLVDDAGFEGLVIKIELFGVEFFGEELVAAAGEIWDAVVARAVAEGLWGLENLSGIPGTVGAAPIQNIGAYGAEVKDTLAWVEAFDTQEERVVRFSGNECGFGYRTSRFKREAGRFVVLRAAFRLQKNGTPNAAYKDLAGAEECSLPEVRERVLAIRSKKFPDLSVEGTAGSFFLNPVVSSEKAAELVALYPNLPHFRAEGGVKLSLAWLLDAALDLKGLSVGKARLFEKQPLVIAASRDASARDVRALSGKVKSLVKEKFNLDLEEEVRIII